jgi:hypothetical protein
MCTHTPNFEKNIEKLGKGPGKEGDYTHTHTHTKPSNKFSRRACPKLPSLGQNFAN